MSIFDKYDNGGGTELDRDEEIDYRHATEQEEGQDLAEEHERSVSYGHLIFASVVVLALFFRLFHVQIVQGRTNATLARENSVRQIIKPASRGNILDRRGVWLARNTPSFKVELVPSDLPRQLSARQAEYDTLAAILGWTEDQKKQQVAKIEGKDGKSLFQIDPITLKDDLSHDDALILTQKLNDLVAVSVVPQQIRQYNQPTDGLSLILGYLGMISPEERDARGLKNNDMVGKSGLEASYDPMLRGVDGTTQALVDSKGKVLRMITDKSQDSVPGQNLILHIDLKLQTIMSAALKDGLSKAGLTSGVAIAMDPRDGSVMGMVSLPSYDNNLFSHGVTSDSYNQLINDPTQPMLNRATMGLFASGSTVKPFVAAVGLQDGVISEHTTIDTPAEITVGQWKFPNWQHFFIPSVDVKTAIAKSNDIFFYSVGGGYDKIKGLGIDQLSKGLGLFGFGQDTGVDLPAEAAGLVPTPDWKENKKKESWYIGDTYHLAIGQGDFLVTPLQLVTALSAVANGGTLYKPHLVDRIVDYNGNTTQTVKPEVVRSHFISDNNIRIVREGMRQTVTDGSGRQLQSLPVSSGAKTGTAQYGPNNEYLHSWFDAFAPYDNPTIALVVLGEKGSQENEGNTTAEPIAKTILEQYFSPDFSK